MACCEKCWAEAFTRAATLGGYQLDRYAEIVAERRAMGTVCTPEEQAGQWWDADRQCDSRTIVEVADV
jgi:hypothetical protein